MRVSLISTIIYKSTNLIENIIDSIDVGKYQSVEYSIKAVNDKFINQSSVKSSTDGVLIFDTQTGSSSNNSSPLEYTTEIVNYQGKLKVTPTSNNITFYIEKTEYESQKYGLHTQSGQKILTNEGFSLDRESTVQSIMVRQANNNFYGSISSYLTSNVLGPKTSGNELITDWISYNNADLVLSPQIKIISSGQNENFIYQKLDVVPGKAYLISFEAYYENPEDVVVKESSAPQRGDAFVRVSSTLEGSELFNYQLSGSYQPIQQIIIPDTTEIYVKVGYGKRSVITHVSSISVKEAVPFPTFNQDTGTYYIKWSGLNNLNLFECNNVLKISSNIIYYNDVNIGTQTTNNQLCISYSPESATVSLNGSTAQTYVINNNNRNYRLELNPSVLKFSYMNELLSNVELETLSSG